MRLAQAEDLETYLRITSSHSGEEKLVLGLDGSPWDWHCEVNVELSDYAKMKAGQIPRKFERDSNGVQWISRALFKRMKSWGLDE